MTAAALVAGCAGQKFNTKSVLQVQLGMTPDEVTSLVGAPLRKEQLLDGRETWVWDYDNGFIRNIAAIIFRDGKVVEVPGKRDWYATQESFDNKVRRDNASELRGIEIEAKLEQKANEAKRIEFDAQQARENYAKTHPERPERILKCLVAQEICVGMNEVETELSWGPPLKKNRSGGAYGRHDQWVYGAGNYVYLDDGLVKSWQTSE
jgi:hypothetical protein